MRRAFILLALASAPRSLLYALTLAVLIALISPAVHADTIVGWQPFTSLSFAPIFYGQPHTLVSVGGSGSGWGTIWLNGWPAGAQSLTLSVYMDVGIAAPPPFETKSSASWQLIFPPSTVGTVYSLSLQTASPSTSVLLWDTIVPVNVWVNMLYQLKADYGQGDVQIEWNQSGNIVQTVYVEPVPEPGSMLMLGSGLVGVAGAVRRRLLG